MAARTDLSLATPEARKVTISAPLEIKRRTNTPMERSVLVMYTGGTLGMKRNREGATDEPTAPSPLRATVRRVAPWGDRVEDGAALASFCARERLGDAREG